MMYISAILLVVLLSTLYYFKNLSLDAIVLLTSVVILIMFAFIQLSHKEHYTQTSDEVTQQVDTKKIKFLNNLLSEPVTNQTKVTHAPVNSSDVEPIANNLQLYVATYSSSSFSGFGTTWYNIAPSSISNKQATCQGDVVSRDFQFGDDPVYDNHKGLYLGTNALKGPPSHTLGIDGRSSFTIFFICQHETLQALGANIFRIFGNSTNNDGISLDIQNVKTSPTPTGVFVLSYAGTKYLGNEVTMDSYITYLYVINKTQNYISLLQFSSVNPTPVTILSTPLTESEVLFSNKRMTFNSNLNWNAFLKAFGTYNYSLSSTDVKNIYDYMMTEEKKMDTLYLKQQSQISSLSQSLSNLQGCPFNANTCNICDKITDWSNHQNIVTSDQTCRAAIAAYCTTNTTNQYCMCWDSNNASYDQPECVHWRNIFDSNSTKGQSNTANLSNLNMETLEQLKKQYNLREVDIDLVEDPLTGQLQTLHINQVPNDLVTNFNITTSTLPNVMIEGGGSSNLTPRNQYISEPVTPTPLGFYNWVISWF